jgi:hypothetical protein
MSGFAALLVALVAAAEPKASSAKHARRRQTDPIVLTISGGVSLGAYQAGFNWTLVRFMKMAELLGGVEKFPLRPELVAVAGTSAGSINALLSAAVWCEKSDDLQDSSVDKNLLRDTWLPIGLDQLLPDDPSRYFADDALLSRRALISVLEDVRHKIFDRSTNRTFTPGCRLPLGLTVTRVAPRERTIGGLTTLTQRFVIPLVFEVTPDGWIRLGPQNLLPDRDSSEYMLRLAEAPLADSGETSVPAEQIGQAILASSAFPVAFSPRDLCTCESACPSERIVNTGTCPGPDPGHPLTGLTCAGLSSSKEQLKLCRWEYVDGGIFDNAPLGLAIDELESWQAPAPLRPVFYAFMDPDLRRSQSSNAKPPGTGTWTEGFSGYLQLFGNLISTSRNVDLARAITAKNWNRTTESLLRELALTLSQFAFLYQQLERLSDRESLRAGETVPTSLPRLAKRKRTGRALYQCLERLHNVRQIQSNLAFLAHCSQAVEELKGGRTSSVIDDRARAKLALSDDEVTTLAQWLAEFVGAGRESAGSMSEVSERLERDPAYRALLRNGVRFSATAFQFLAEETRRIAYSPLPEEKIRRFRDALLEATGLGDRLSTNSNRLAHGVLIEYLGWIQRQGPASVSAAAARALEIGEGMPSGELFAVGTLSPVLDSLNASIASGSTVGTEQAQMVTWLRQGHDLENLRSSLQQLSSKISTLVQTASELQRQTTGERQLWHSTRFAPLAGSQLLNFAAFLDRPLREFDYYAGVYDGVHELAVGSCTNGAAYLDVPQPQWRLDDPEQLDVESVDTQRCIGNMMGWIARLLRLQESTKARQVLGALAVAELSVALGDEAAARRLSAEAEWAWVRDYALVVPGDSLQAVLGAMLSRRVRCTQDAKQALCIADLEFDQFVAALRARGYRPDQANMQLLINEPNRWLNSTVKKAADRSATIELNRSNPPSSIERSVLLALGAGELWTRRALKKSGSPRLVIDPSSLPDEPKPPGQSWIAGAFHLLPYRVALDVSRGGVALAWLEPELLLTQWLSLVSLLEPIDYESRLSRLSTTIGMLPTAHFAGMSFGAGPRLSFHWTQGQGVDLGLQTQLSFLQDRFSLGLGVRQLSGARFSQHWFVFLSVSDFNGTIYWLGPWSSGQKK